MNVLQDGIDGDKGNSCEKRSQTLKDAINEAMRDWVAK